ncbi:hypothetical protein [Phytobacter massiliensis]
MDNLFRTLLSVFSLPLLAGHAFCGEQHWRSAL